MTKTTKSANPLDALGLAVSYAQTARMVLKHPRTDAALIDREGREGFVELLGPDSEPAQRFRDLAAPLGAELAAKARGGNRRDRRARRAPDDSASEADILERLEALQLERAVASVAAWHLVSADGEAVAFPCTPENVRELLTHPGYVWLREDIAFFLSDQENFTN